MTHGLDHAAQRLGIGLLDRLADAAQPDRAQRVPLAAVRAVRRLDLGDDERAHGAVTSAELSTTSASVSVSAGASPFATGWAGAADKPRTLSTERPRSAAISSGLGRSCRPAIVALTRLIGFCEPSDFERMSWIPASSSTARTPPPAITPVPGEAGLRNTRPELKMPVVWCVMVLPWRGTRKRFFFAFSTPFWIASGTSFALP